MKSLPRFRISGDGSAIRKLLEVLRRVGIQGN